MQSLIKGISDDLFSQKYRFSEFNEDWPIYCVSDFLEFFSTNSLSWENLEYRNSSFLNLHYGLIHQGLPIQIDLTECYLPGVKTDYIPNNYTLCHDGDVVFADASEDTNDVAKVVEFINCDNKRIVCGLHTIHARDKINITVTGFKGYAFSSKLFRNQIRQLAQGTKVFSVSAKTFKECRMNIPSKNEQLKITNILSLIDRKIAAEKRVLAQLNQQKIYLLKNLFI